MDKVETQIIPSLSTKERACMAGEIVFSHAKEGKQVANIEYWLDGALQLILLLLPRGRVSGTILQNAIFFFWNEKEGALENNGLRKYCTEQV